jgi:hypothetical protein
MQRSYQGNNQNGYLSFTIRGITRRPNLGEDFDNLSFEISADSCDLKIAFLKSLLFKIVQAFGKIC